MPHPDRACHRRLGSEDGKLIFQSHDRHARRPPAGRKPKAAPCQWRNRPESRQTGG